MMSQPQPDNKPPSQDDPTKIIRWLDSLHKCSGWTEWLKPDLTKRYEDAKASILDAIAEGKEPSDAAKATYRTLHQFLSLLKTHEAKAVNALTTPKS